MRKTNQLILCAGLCACSAFTVAAVPVTFQVNMDYQISQTNFTPASGRVEVRGPEMGWGPGLQLTNIPSTTLYQNTLEYTGTPGTTYSYKFWNNGSGSSDNWESDANRPFSLSSSAQTISRYFNDLWAGGPPIAVTFQLNMGIRLANGSFNPATQEIGVRGAFQGWTTGWLLTQSPGDTNIFIGTFGITNVPPGSLLQYKFFAGDWESRENRFTEMPGSATTLPVVYFNDEIPTSIPVTFQVDMTYAAGFNPATDTVEARGTFQSLHTWSTGFTLTNAPDSLIYSGTTNVAHLSGTQEQYKFAFVDSSLQTHWESDPNRTFTLATSAQVLPVDRFNRLSNTNDFIAEDTLVTFSVDMSSATNHNLAGRTFPFDPAKNMPVYINGDFLAWWDWNSPPGKYELKETYPGSLIYTNTVLAPRGSLVALTYKYGVDTYNVDANSSSDTEAGFGQNHVRYIRTLGGTTVFPTDTFGLMEVEPIVGSLSIGKPVGGYVSISWRGRPGVHLEASPDFTGWTEVPNTYGASSANISVGTTPAYYRLVKP